MSIIVKFILRNIKEKKFRTFLILISIMMSSALVFASLAISTTAEDMIIDNYRKFFGSADITVNAGMNMKNSFISPSLLDDYDDGIKYVAGEVVTSGEYKHNDETIRLTLEGYTLDDLEKMYSIVPANKYNLEPFKGKKAIIGKGIAEKYGLKLGDSMGIKMMGTTKWFTISAISEPKGPFDSYGGSVYIVVPRETLAGFYDERGKVQTLYVGLENPELQDVAIQKLSQAYPYYRVDATIPKADLEKETEQISTIFLIMAMFVVILSVFIIYTSYKVIMMERLPIIGTFRSIGATKKITNRVMKIESLIYGVIGGILGIILGIGILYLMTKQIMSTELSSGGTVIHFKFSQLLIAFIFAIVLAYISSTRPIKKASKVPLKDVILNKLEVKPKRKKLKLIIGIIFFSFGLGAPFVAPKNTVINVISMFLLIPAVIFIVPYITNIFLKVFEKFYGWIFGNEGIIATQNLRNNKSNVNNITLLGISIAVVLMINILSYSMAQDTISYYGNYKYDINVYTWPSNRTAESILLSVDGVEDTYGTYSQYDVDIVDKDSKITVIDGVDPSKYLNYMNISTEEENIQEILDKLSDERNIIITYSLKDKLGVQKGDYLKLKTSRGVLPYCVIGYFDSERFGGSHCLIADRYIKSDMAKKEYGEIYIKTNKDPEVVAESIREKFKNRPAYITTLNEQEQQNLQGTEKIMGIFKGFSILALIIGVFGVFNNLIINFIQRKRSLAVLRSIGMNKKQSIKMIFVEAFTGGLIGSLVGICMSGLLIYAVCKVFESMEGSMNNFVKLSGATFIEALLIGIIITIIASIIPALKSSKLNIIESIKYE